MFDLTLEIEVEAIISKMPLRFFAFSDIYSFFTIKHLKSAENSCQYLHEVGLYPDFL